MPRKAPETWCLTTRFILAREIALAAGVSELQVAEAIERAGGDRRSYVRHADAVRIGRRLAKVGRAPFTAALALLERHARPIVAQRLVWSGTAHAGIVAAALVIATSNLAPRPRR